MTISLQVGSDVIRSYRRLAYTPWHALAEFVDNSTQSYFDNRAPLDAALGFKGEGFEVRIVYDRDNGTIRISDNAMGMGLAELESALKIGKVPANTKGRSQYGLGMKTAACWLGNRWTVSTKKLGEGLEHRVTIDVEAVANGRVELPYESTSKPSDLHYTWLEIRDLNSELKGRTLGKIKDFLRSMYRVDLREGLVNLYWEGTPLEWEDALEFLRAVDGSEYRKPINFPVNGKRVSGWVGILKEGARSRAGFAMLRRGRVLRAHPNEWRPEQIFGQGGRNDLINQRITGELHFDDFEVSHTKDAILFLGDEEDEVENELKRQTADYVDVAREYRKGVVAHPGPTDTEVQTGVEELRTEMESKEFVDLVQIQEVPPPALIESANKPILEAAKRAEPRFTATVGDTECSLYLSYDASPNDPYFATDVTGDRIMVVINWTHPYVSQISGSEGVLNYLRHCVYDAIAEWKCRRVQATLQPSTVKGLKDALLRLPSKIEHTGGAA